MASLAPMELSVKSKLCGCILLVSCCASSGLKLNELYAPPR